MQSESLDAVDSTGRVLRVVFTWRGDRFGHAISAIHADGAQEILLESQEGTPADDWPPSPPLQNLHRETLADGRAALLLVGAAGRGHWSASVEAANDQPRLVFDLACRVDAAKGWLGSRYRIHPSASARVVIEADDAEVNWFDRSVNIMPRTIEPPTMRWTYKVCLTKCNEP